jgi:CelD/BcsL family acetyltransferase involved in cellulose biosynthesis
MMVASHWPPAPPTVSTLGPRPSRTELFSARPAPVLRAFATDWEDLTRATCPFLRAEWFALTARFLALGEPILLVARAAGHLRAALALCRQGRTLRSLDSAHTPRFDLVGDPGALPGLWRLLRTDDGWDTLRLDAVPQGSPLATTLPRLAEAEGCYVRIGPGPRSPWLSLDRFEARLSAKFRANLRRRAHKLGEATLERVTVVDQEALAAGLALEAAGWKGAGGTGTAIACEPRLRRFYTSLAHAFASRGELALCFLRVGARRIAFQLGLEDGRAYYLLKPGFDPAFAKFGPGQLLVHQVAADAARRGLEELDFLGWEMDWKREWTAETRPHVAVVIHRRTLRGSIRAAGDFVRSAARDLRQSGREGREEGAA